MLYANNGFFSLIAEKTLSWSRTPLRLLIIITFITGVASAFLVNDAVVLLFTPVIIAICRASSLNPVPYLIAEILSSNIGSAMTITGNPQNMLIGMNPGIDYTTFFYKLLPVLRPLPGEILWLTLASASTLAGNATIIGAMANLIVIESAGKQQVTIRFWEFFKIGMVVTLFSFVISVAVLWLLL